MQWPRAMLSALHVAVLAELLVGGGSVNLRTQSIRHDSAEQWFSYDYSKHGQDWTAGICASRARQSPIDLPPPGLPATSTFAYKYNPIVEPFEMMNNGHAYSVDLAGLGYGGLTYDNAWYNLMNINIHSLSEHTWNGMQMPLELHLVHKRYDGEALLIVAIAVESPLLTGAAMAAAAQQQALELEQQRLAALGQAFLQVNASRNDIFQQAGKQGPITGGVGYTEPPATEPMFNPALQAFLKMPPPPVNMKVRVPADSVNFFDLNSLYTGGAFYEYYGSLTAPPCSEIATWLVRQDTIKGSDKQIMYLHDSVYKITADFGNYRSLMPLNGRVIGLRQGMYEDMSPTAAPKVPMPGRPQQSDREFRAMKWAMDAMTIAKSATDYVKDLDNRLRNAAQAHANALAPQIEPLKVHGQVVVPGGAAAAAAASYAAAGIVPPGGIPASQSPVQMQKTAEQMARTLAAAAREEIEDATVEISKKSKEVAMQAAREAAGIVMSGQGNPGALAAGAMPATPASASLTPGVPAATPPGLQPGPGAGAPPQAAAPLGAAPPGGGPQPLVPATR